MVKEIRTVLLSTEKKLLLSFILLYYREPIHLAKANAPDQNAINLSSLKLTSLQKYLRSKGTSFVPTPKDVNWYEPRKNFTKFQLNQDHQKLHTFQSPYKVKTT